MDRCKVERRMDGYYLDFSFDALPRRDGGERQCTEQNTSLTCGSIFINAIVVAEYVPGFGHVGSHWSG